jgi:hypothetical protein
MSGVSTLPSNVGGSAPLSLNPCMLGSVHPPAPQESGQADHVPRRACRSDRCNSPPLGGRPLHGFGVHVRLPSSHSPVPLVVQLYVLSPLGLYPTMHSASHMLELAQSPCPHDFTWGTLGGFPLHIFTEHLRGACHTARVN